MEVFTAYSTFSLKYFCDIRECSEMLRHACYVFYDKYYAVKFTFLYSYNYNGGSDRKTVCMSERRLFTVVTTLNNAVVVQLSNEQGNKMLIAFLHLYPKPGIQFKERGSKTLQVCCFVI